jgi:hypothetical protein
VAERAVPLRRHLGDPVKQRAQSGDDDQIHPESGAGGSLGSDGADKHAGRL